jgi:tripartite ATP-independent transporter DctM subunit
MGITQMIMVAMYAYSRKYPRNPKPTLRIFWRAFKEAFWAILAPLILLVGIYSGIFTTTEAAIVAAFYSLFLGIFVYKEISLKDIPRVLFATCETNGVVMAMVMASAAFGWMLSVSQVPQAVSAFLISATTSKIFLLVMINIFLLIVGMFMDSTASILILSPILVPVMVSFGVDITQACIIIVLNLMIGLVTPPVGIVLYVVSNVSGVSFERVTKATLPFLIPLIVVLAMVTFMPWVTLFIPNLVYNK